MKKIIVTSVFALAAAVSFADFSAGFARVDVTPPLGIPLVGYFSHRVADGVLDPLYVDCVAVSDGTNRGRSPVAGSMGSVSRNLMRILRIVIAS